MAVVPTLKNRDVLVVEDEFIIAFDLCEKLQALGCRVVGPAPSVEKALSLIEAEAPEAALINENLSGESIAPVAALLQKRQIPFAVVSGYETARCDLLALSSAARVLKPVSADAVREVLKGLLGRRTERRSFS